MDWLTPEFLLALLNIIVIDLVLAGDNAIVIALAARNLPKDQQKGAIIWGTVGAVVIRIIATVAVVWLLKLPALLIIGAVLLIWIAYKLLVENKEDHAIEAKSRLTDAIKTIIIADAAMGFDNVIAVAGAAHGSFTLVILGLIISVPIMVWGSTLFLKLIDKFPIIITIGSAVLAYTAAKMLTEDRLVVDYFHANPVVKWGLIAIIVVGVIGAAYWKKKSDAVVKVTENGSLSIPVGLEKEADIKPSDSFTASRDEKGRLVLHKSQVTSQGHH
ncbi:TerC family protein [Paenibacillus sp. YYML68]|uniref:TerC family protein n=1 Tax=Paenibacillus sp. YYML68 TaxID=2909250 RepID=UPI0024926CC4|nr:TerC family protein [Paenibacillus sp. YYML68]